MMRVGIDCTVTGRPPTGFETYVSCLANALVRLESDAAFVFFVPRPVPPDIASLLGRSSIVTSPFRTQILAHQAWLASTAHLHHVDLMHYPAFPPLRPPGKFVMTVHDATPWKFAETMSAKARIYFQSTLALWTRKSRLIITPSESSKQEISRQFRIPEHRVKVIRHGVRNSLRAVSNGEGVDLPPTLRSAPPYVLFVGTIEPRKNLPLAIRALARLQSKGQLLRLVIAGRVAWGIAEVERIREEEGVKDSVMLMGHVSDQELSALYRHAVCLVQPSVHEGFGYTIVEAMALGCPVVASNIPPHAEVLGDAGLYISTHDVDGLVAAISRMLQDDAFRASLAARSIERSHEFTWKRSAERTLEVYKEAIAS